MERRWPSGRPRHVNGHDASSRFPSEARAAAGVSRRRLIAAAGAGLMLVSSTGELQLRANAAVGTPEALATPIVVPGFDDPKRWEGRTLHVGAWGGEIQRALRETTWGPFGAATGCTIQEVMTDYAKLRHDVEGGRFSAGVLVVDALFAATALAGGYVQRLDHTVIDGNQIAPLSPTDGSVPAFAYAMVDAFRWDGVDGKPPQNWREWWDKMRWPGGRALQRGALGTFEFALLADGVAPDRLYPLDGQRAIDSLKAISGKIVDRWWDSGAEPVAWLANGRVDLTSSWHYRVVAGRNNGYPVDLVWSQGLLLADHWVIPTGDGEQDVAMDFLRYATAPEVQAALAHRVPLGPVNPAAFNLLDARTAASLPTAPANLGQLIPLDVAWWAEHNVEANERFNNWLLGVPDAPR